MPLGDSFAARLAMIRHEMGWNLKEAALACGFPPGSWREWELRGRDPRGLVEIAERIAERTGVDHYWLMTGRVSPGTPPDPQPAPPTYSRRGGARSKLPRVDSNHQPSGYRPEVAVVAA